MDIIIVITISRFENDVITTPGSGRGFQGFYLAYWMNSCS